MAVVAAVVVAVAAMAPVVVQESIAACELPPRPAHLRRILVSMLIRKMRRQRRGVRLTPYCKGTRLDTRWTRRQLGHCWRNR